MAVKSSDPTPPHSPTVTIRVRTKRRRQVTLDQLFGAKPPAPKLCCHCGVYSYDIAAEYWSSPTLLFYRHCQACHKKYGTTTESQSFSCRGCATLARLQTPRPSVIPAVPLMYQTPPAPAPATEYRPPLLPELVSLSQKQQPPPPALQHASPAAIFGYDPSPWACILCYYAVPPNTGS